MSVGLRRCLMFVSLSLASILCPSIAQACKDRIYPAKFPTAELQSYEHVYVIWVERMTNIALSEGGRFAKSFSFEGKVIRVFKGSGKVGDAIRGSTTGEEAHARCPISLEAGKAYLLMLNGNGATYTLPRSGSFYVSSDRPEFESYLAELAKISR